MYGSDSTSATHNKHNILKTSIDQYPITEDFGENKYFKTNLPLSTVSSKIKFEFTPDAMKSKSK